MTIKDLIDRGYKPFANYDGTCPLETYYFSTYGPYNRGYTNTGGYLGIFFIKENIAVSWSLNYVYPIGAHNPPCLETIYNKRTGRYIEVAFLRTSKISKV